MCDSAHLKPANEGNFSAAARLNRVQADTDNSLNAWMGWQRNQFDRLVHLSYGLLFVLPIRELLQRQAMLRGAWLALCSVSFVLATSALYELLEWMGGQYLGDDLAQAFLATQQDPWDAQKDMALALLGALVTLINARQCKKKGLSIAARAFRN
ncbi:DUF2238 domain-containing protein [Pseudomonas sp. p21]|uniref:DUF2238 domain-containing protein n=1 Tax=Pseudomonas sp. p21 TaxID=1825979 RepID=UPI003525A3AB